MTYLPDATGVVVIGAGAAGSAAAAHLSAAGVDVLLLERSAESDTRPGAAALTPAAVRELEVLGLPESDTAGLHRTTGVRFVAGAAGGMRLALAWPDAQGRATHGLADARSVLDATLASYAVRSGARLRRATEVTGLTRDAAGRVTGVTTGDGATLTADLVIDASGGALPPAPPTPTPTAPRPPAPSRSPPTSTARVTATTTSSPGCASPPATSRPRETR